MLKSIDPVFVIPGINRILGSRRFNIILEISVLDNLNNRMNDISDERVVNAVAHTRLLEL